MTAPDRRLTESVAGKFQRGDLEGAKADCERVLAGAHSSSETAAAHFWMGVIEARRGSLSAACKHYELALALDRTDPQWLLQAGLTYFQLADMVRAEALYRDALRLNPNYALAHYNLGILLQHQRDTLGACHAFEAAMRHRPQFPEAHTNLANTLLEMGDADRAEAHYREALAQNPRLANAHYGLGLHYLRHQRYDAAIRCFAATVENNPALLDAWLDLAECHHLTGRDDRALECVKQVLVREPAHTTARFKLAQFSGSQPPNAPAEMIERLYAGMAGTFDEHVTQRLGYRVPSLLIDELTPWLGEFATRNGYRPRVLDLGCGTGLLGAAVRSFASRLIGVDLSAAMLEKARERGIYDELIESDLQPYLFREASGNDDSFDLVTATDVFIYVGRVDALFSHIATRLSPGGLFAFSVESPRILVEECRLESSGRYAHSTGYIERLAVASGLEITRRIETVIRTEGAIPLDGHIYILRKTSAAA